MQFNDVEGSRQPCQHLITQFLTGRMHFLLVGCQEEHTTGKKLSDDCKVL